MFQLIKNTAILFLLLCSCQTGNKEAEKPNPLEKDQDTIALTNQEIIPPSFDSIKHLENYQKLKRQIARDRNQIKNRDDLSEERKWTLAEKYMSKTLVDSIFPYWLGTKWDFNGYTEKPRVGEVACGYFVSTTLRDLGISLNRFRVAQKGAADIVKELCDPESIESISSLEKLVDFLETIREEEILVVGLDFHVGFIFKKQEHYYFAHSNYINQKGVEIELLQNSTALRNTNLYVVGSLTQNKKILRDWLN